MKYFLAAGALEPSLSNSWQPVFGVPRTLSLMHFLLLVWGWNDKSVKTVLNLESVIHLDFMLLKISLLWLLHCHVKPEPKHWQFQIKNRELKMQLDTSKWVSIH